jgi:hypothetical protein
MTEPDYIAELEQIRSAYICSLPRQRLHVISQRLDNPAHGPNLLVTYVSAVEALARSLAMHVKSPSKAQLKQLYGKYRDREVKSLVIEYLASHGHDSPSDFFGSDTWRKFGYAVSYRNMLVHECTYLGQDKYPHLRQACQEVLQKLSGLAGLPVEA